MAESVSDSSLPLSEPVAARRGLPVSSRTMRRFLADRRILVALVILGVALFVAIFAPWIAPYEPTKMGAGPPKQPPMSGYPLGTDPFGRDQLSRIIYGARISVGVALLVLGGSFAAGIPLGMFIGHVGGRIDYAVGRLLDVVFAFPTILLALILSTLFAPSLQTAIIALIIVYIPIVARFVRGVTRAEHGRDYVLGARVAGASPLRLLVSHVLPNIASPLLVLASSVMAFSVLAEAGLSYLGFGAQPPTSSWGKMLTENSSYYATDPYLALFPGLAITILVLGLNLLGDGLRDHLDPRYRSAIS